MKTINYTGSSKLISRIVNLLNRKAPLPLDGDGDPDWGSNGQVLSTDGSGNTAWVNQGGGGSGGHTIEDADGTAMTQRAGLQFVGATVTDDSANDRTVVTVPTAHTYTEGDGIDINSSDVISVDTTFTEASTRANIASGDTFATILGKIKKFFTDLKTVAFTGSYNDLSNQPTIPTDFVSKANGGTFEGNIVVDKQDGTTSSVGITELVIGNNKGQGVDKNSRGFFYLFSATGKWARLRNDNGTANRNIYFPDKDGTIALTSDLPTYQSIAVTMLGETTVQNSSSAVFGTFTLPTGKWLLNFRGYSPLTPTYTEVQSQATLLLVRKSGQSGWDIIASLSYWMNYWQLFDVSSSTAYRLGLQNWEGHAVTISSSYSMSITAVKIG